MNFDYCDRKGSLSDSRKGLWLAIEKKWTSVEAEKRRLGLEWQDPVFRRQRPAENPFEIRLRDLSRGDARLLLEFREVAWEMVRSGLLVPYSGPDPMPDYQVADQFILTEHGKWCLEENDPAFPLDVEGIVAAIRKDFAGTDGLENICFYAAEAIEAFRHGLYSAAATMIGCAYELSILQLASAVLRKWPVESNNWIAGPAKQAAKSHQNGEYAKAGHLADALFKTLDANAGQYSHWLKTCFISTIYFVREMRNEAGHPTGRRFEADEVICYIHLFRPWYGRIRAIIAEIA